MKTKVYIIIFNLILISLSAFSAEEKDNPPKEREEKTETQNKKNEDFQKKKAQETKTFTDELGLSENNTNLVSQEIKRMIGLNISTPEMRVINAAVKTQKTQAALNEANAIVSELKKRKDIVQKNIVDNFDSKKQGAQIIEGSVTQDKTRDVDFALPDIRNCFTGPLNELNIDPTCECLKNNSCAKAPPINNRLNALADKVNKLRRQGANIPAIPKEVLEFASLNNKLLRTRLRGDQKKVERITKRLLELAPIVKRINQRDQKRRKKLIKGEIFQKNLRAQKALIKNQLNRVKSLSRRNSAVKKAFELSGIFTPPYNPINITKRSPLERILGRRTFVNIPYKSDYKNSRAQAPLGEEALEQGLRLTKNKKIGSQQVENNAPHEEYEIGDGDINTDKYRSIFHNISHRYLQKYYDLIQ